MANWLYLKNQRTFFISFRAKSEKTRATLSDPELKIHQGKKLKVMFAWMSNDGLDLRYLIGGNDKEMKAFRLKLSEAKKRDEINKIKSFKIKRWLPNTDPLSRRICLSRYPLLAA